MWPPIGPAQFQNTKLSVNYAMASPGLLVFRKQPSMARSDLSSRRSSILQTKPVQIKDPWTHTPHRPTSREWA